MGNHKPAHAFRIGGIDFAIWKNVTKNGENWFNVTVVRTYKDGEEYKESSSFRKDDLPVVSKGLDMAYGWILRQQLKQRQDRSQQSGN